MANQNIIEEYLVKLGFAPADNVGFSRFQRTLQDVASLVDNKYLGMAKSVFQFQLGVTSALASVGLAAVGIADKTAMADQQYRLLALHMYTSLPVARELKVALDALGQPLENVMWDPELAGRFHQLVKDQQTMTQQLGPDFENQMLKIRDVRFEFSRFGVEIQYLTMLVVEDLAKAFGTSIDGLLEKMRHFNDWLISNMPQIAAWITAKLVPVLKEVWQVLEDTWMLLRAIGDQLKGINWVGVVGDIGKAIIGLIQLEQNIIMLFAAANAARKGNFAEAMNDLRSMQVVTGKSQSAVPDGVNTLEGAGRGLATPANVQAAIISQSRALGVPPELALAVAQIESNFSQFDKSGNVLTSNQAGSHATGIFQLQPGTARSLGVNPSDTGENISGGVRYLKQLLDRYGSPEVALQHYYGSKNPADNAAYAGKVMQAETTIHVEVNVDTNADPQKIAAATAKAVADAQNQRTQRNIAEFQQPGWSY